MPRAELTAERLRELLHYDPETGCFRWLDRSKMKRGGEKAGCTSGESGVRPPRVCIRIDGYNYKAHRVAWLYVHGRWPVGVIDHRNGDTTDNRIANLRDVSQLTNTQNRRVTLAASGLMGAFQDKRRGTWKSSIRSGGKAINLGRFKTPEEAHQAYLTAKRRLHEGCTI